MEFVGAYLPVDDFPISIRTAARLQSQHNEEKASMCSLDVMLKR